MPGTGTRSAIRSATASGSRSTRDRRWRAGEDELPAGAVVTVEPGVYVPGLGGVRIEDMVEVTEDGCRVLADVLEELIEL